MTHRAQTILHVLAEPGVGLAARQLALLASDPDPRYVHKVVLLHRDPAVAAFLAAQQLHVFLREHTTPSAFLPFAFVAGRWLSELAERTHADLIQAHDGKAAAAASPVAHKKGCPFVRTVTTADGVDHLLQRFELKRTKLFVASSEHVRRGLLRRVPLLAPKMALAPTAQVAPSSAVPPREIRRGARLRLHLVGVPPHQDGVVMQALREVADLVIAHDFVEVTRQPAVDVTRQPAVDVTRQPAVDATPSGDPDTIRHVDAVVAAGPVPLGHDADEPVELPVLRAMAHGRPALVVPGGALTELALPADGPPCGVVARDGSVAALVDAVRQLAEQPLAELGARARTAFQREHSEHSLRARYRAFYDAALMR